MTSYSDYLGARRCCDLRGLALLKAIGPSGPTGPTGPVGPAGPASSLTVLSNALDLMMIELNNVVPGNIYILSTGGDVFLINNSTTINTYFSIKSGVALPLTYNIIAKGPGGENIIATITNTSPAYNNPVIYVNVVNGVIGVY